MYRASATGNEPNGTLPTTAWKLSSPRRTCSNPAAWTSWEGCRWAAMRAVVASSSTPTMSVPAGAWPMNSPDPHPGSSTLPSLNPARDSAPQMAWAWAGSV
ncbi:hypothetical protein ACFFX0_25820 [Citricoccus parietis]|uniref:Uncharacterized protein n=1 Tax=Citricoccus parietis TaxID=592307 RepID=A0ABV5G699_9MICC